MRASWLAHLIRGSLGLTGRVLRSRLVSAQREAESGIVLLYHRVSPDADPNYQPMAPAAFREQLRAIGELYRFVTLEEFVRRLSSGSSLKNLCAVTFDDGFLDFAQFAYPVLRDLNVPVTHFVTVEGVLRGTPTWNYRLNRLLHVVQLSSSLSASARRSAPSLNERLRQTATLARLTVEARESLLSELERSVGITDQPGMLRREDIARLDSTWVDWGSHSVSHPTLPYCSSERAEYELRYSKAALEDALGVPIRFLAYPNAAFDDRTMAIAAAAGYEASFTAYQRRVTAAAPTHAIPRFDISEIPEQMTHLELTEITPSLRRLVRRSQA